MKIKRKRIPTIEQKIITNLIKLGNRPRDAFKMYEEKRFNSQMNFITLSA